MKFGIIFPFGRIGVERTGLIRTVTISKIPFIGIGRGAGVRKGHSFRSAPKRWQGDIARAHRQTVRVSDIDRRHVAGKKGKRKLKRGDMLLAGQEFGRVRGLFDESGNQVQSAGPSTPSINHS